mgnify:CR=1 FL=1
MSCNQREWLYNPFVKQYGIRTEHEIKECVEKLNDKLFFMLEYPLSDAVENYNKIKIYKNKDISITTKLYYKS